MSLHFSIYLVHYVLYHLLWYFQVPNIHTCTVFTVSLLCSLISQYLMIQRIPREMIVLSMVRSFLISRQTMNQSINQGCSLVSGTCIRWCHRLYLLYTVGVASHGVDYKKSAGGFIHGFRYTGMCFWCVCECCTCSFSVA